MDTVLEAELGDRLIRPGQVEGLLWPTLAQAAGKFVLILDERGDKQALYLEGWQARPMFTIVEPPHEAAKVLVLNDPATEFALIQQRVREGYLVRTRADADTVEARANDTTRRAQALASGAQAVSTDYYLPAAHFGNNYQVRIEGGVRCNPVSAPPDCRL